MLGRLRTLVRCSINTAQGLQDAIQVGLGHGGEGWVRSRHVDLNLVIVSVKELQGSPILAGCRRAFLETPKTRTLKPVQA